MNIRLVDVLAMTILALTSTTASAAYTRTSSAPVTIVGVYANEWGSPFIRVSETINPVSHDGNGLFLFNLEITAVGDHERNLRNHKVAIALSAQLAEKRVVLDYFYDPSLTGWPACYIHGIEIVD